MYYKGENIIGINYYFKKSDPRMCIYLYMVCVCMKGEWGFIFIAKKKRIFFP
jgi:hypothetical protein